MSKPKVELIRCNSLVAWMPQMVGFPLSDREPLAATLRSKLLLSGCGGICGASRFVPWWTSRLVNLWPCGVWYFTHVATCGSWYQCIEISETSTSAKNHCRMKCRRSQADDVTHDIMGSRHLLRSKEQLESLPMEEVQRNPFQKSNIT